VPLGEGRPQSVGCSGSRWDGYTFADSNQFSLSLVAIVKAAMSNRKSKARRLRFPAKQCR